MYMYLCVSVCLLHKYNYLHEREEGMKPLGAGIAGGCHLFDTGSKN